MSPALAEALAAVHEACARSTKPMRLSGRYDFLEAEDHARYLGRSREALGPCDLHDWIDDGPGAMPPAEIGWFLPRLCTLMTRGAHCNGGLGWSYALSWLPRSGFPEDWTMDRTEAVRAFVAALVADAAVTPERFDLDLGRGEGLAAMLHMAVNCGVGLDPVLSRLAALPPPHLARRLASWTLQTGWSGTDAGGLGPEGQVAALSADLFVSEPHARVFVDWLTALDMHALLTRAVRHDTHPEWREVIEEAAIPWQPALRPSAEGPAVSPWRSRSRRRWRRRRWPRPMTG